MQIDDLRRAFVLDVLTDEQLLDLIGVGEEVHYGEGDVLFRQGDPADCWWVLLDGRVDLFRRVGREEAVANVMDRPGLWAGGFRAWDDGARYYTTGVGAVPGRMFRVPSEALAERARAWFPLGVHIIEGLFQTVRRMDELSRQRESLIALGTLAAGLAHEINNPAAAAVRAVDALRSTCDTLLSSLLRMVEGSRPADQLRAIDALRQELDAPARDGTPLAIADREEALTEWLDAHAIADGWRLAPILAAAGVDVGWCERAAELVTEDTLAPGLEWVASTLSTTALLAEVKEATGRISELVAAVKSYSQLDRASWQLIDVTEGIESTLVMLGHKLHGVTVVRDFGADVPRLEANAGELNQVWTNLLDNAVDAMGGAGTLRVSVRADGDDALEDEGDAIVVEIADTGIGMPPDVQARAFDPFYTTKEVGDGTGLGLDISRRIVEHHAGRITIESVPGDTVVRVRRLPRRRTEPS